jgi:5'-nucleotidase
MKAKNDTLTIGFTAGTLFDMKEAEDIFEKADDKDKQRLYRAYFKEMNDKNDIFKPGPALGLYMAFQNLKDKIKVSENVETVAENTNLLIRFGLSSKFDSAHPGAITLFNSIEHYMMKEGQHHSPDYLNLTGGFEQAMAHKIQDADLVFTSSDKSADLYYNNGIASVYIPNKGPKFNLDSYKNHKSNLNIYCDYDGVIGDANSESLFQAALQLKDIDPVNTFRDHEVSKSREPMELGPLGGVLKKFGIIVEFYKEKLMANEIKEEDIPFKTILLTARGGGAASRAFHTLNQKGISLSQCLFMDGVNKNEALSLVHKKDMTLFLDDGKKHFERAMTLDNIIAGYVPNELTVGNIDMKEKLLRLTESLNDAQKARENIVALAQGKPQAKLKNK